MSVSRRELLQHAAAGAAVLGTTSNLPANEPAAPPIVDTHLHLWDPARMRLPWLDTASPLNRRFELAEYRTATEGQNVVKAVYMEVDVGPRQHVAEAEYVLDLCRRGGTPLVAAVIGGQPASDDFRAYLQRFRGERRLKGIRAVLHAASTPAGTALAPAFIRGVRLLGEMGLSFDLCMRPTDLGDAVRLVEACPDTRFILDHCGNGPVLANDRTQWQRDMDRLARIPRVMCKISGIVVQARERWTPETLAPVVNYSLDAFGPERVMFAGDWPVCTTRATFGQWLDALKTIVRDRPRVQQRQLFHDNAMRYYGLA